MKLKNILLITALLMPLMPLKAATIEWLTQYDEAVTEAKKTKKPLLLFFTGSDWCGWCKKLDREVLSTPDFAAEVGNKFVFLKLDFPHSGPNAQAIKDQNEQYQTKYAIQGFPTIILLDPQNLQKIGQSGYRAGGPKPFATHLLKQVSDFSSYKQKTEQVEQQKLSGAELKRLYEKAKELDLYTDVNHILKAGLSSDDPHFFQLERYRFLIAEGGPLSSEALTLRKELLAADPKNERKLPYQLAVMDFEAFSEEAKSSPDLAVGPLVTYIEQFGADDPENLWRLEMIISQVYLDHDKLSQALKYAQSSHDAAPANVQPEIAKAICNMQIFAHH